jgi:hypothetical protein
MPEGYCTLDDLRRALQESDLPGDVSQEKRLAVDAITAQTEWLEKTLKRHWYAPTGADILDEASEIDIPTAPKSRDDEYDIPTASAIVVDDDGPRRRPRRARTRRSASPAATPRASPSCSSGPRTAASRTG